MFKRLAVLLIGALLLFGLSACDSVKSMTSNVTVGKVIEEFKAAGLEADNPSDYQKKNLEILEKKQSAFLFQH
ncbi:putative lipoprotein [Bacillus toyonensis]